MLLEVRDLDVSYGRVMALHGVSLAVDEGELVVLLGPNGAGKTTLLRTISGLHRARRGEIIFSGRPLRGLPAHAIAQAGVAHVPQGRQVFPDLTVEENLNIGGTLIRRQRQLYRETLEGVYALFPRLAERRAQAAGTLSGGEQQMLAVGRALMSRPRLLMLDEPSLGLAPRLVQEMFSYFRRLHDDRKLAILLVEQVAQLALQIADRAYVLVNGRVVLGGPADAIAADPRVQEVYLGGAEALSAPATGGI